MEVAESKKCVYDQITIRLRSVRSDYDQNANRITIKTIRLRSDYDQIPKGLFAEKSIYQGDSQKKSGATYYAQITLGLRSDYDQNTLRVRLAKSGDSDSSNEFINACASVSNLLTMRFPLCAQSEMLQAAPPLLP